MRFVPAVLPLLLIVGCAQPKPAETDFAPVPGPSQSRISLPPPSALPAAPPKTNAPAAKPPIVTPDTARTGKVVRFNPGSRIVVMQFPIVNMPAIGTTIYLYRGGLKVGEVKVTGPQKADHTVGDLLAGEAQLGDVARDR